MTVWSDERFEAKQCETDPVDSKKDEELRKTFGA